DMFSDEDGIASALRPLSEKIQLLESRHRAAIRLFEGISHQNDTACVELLRQDDIRAKFELDFLRFAEAMDMVLPNPKALEDPYPSDLKWLSRIRVLARRAYHEEPFDPKDYGAKVGEIITSHLFVTGVEQLLVKFDILDPAFRPHLESLRSSDTKAAEIEHAIRQEIHVHRDENPTAYASLWEQLERIVNDRREARVSAASALTQLEAMVGQAADIRSGATSRSDGLNGTAAAILPFIDNDLPDAERSRSAAGITKALEEYAEVVDWQHKEDVQRQMRRSIKEQLRSLGLDAHKIEATTAKIMDVARARYAG
ncbi:type I restriction enzyme endonuclease domain-containing protein, partial [Brucella abortus]